LSQGIIIVENLTNLAAVKKEIFDFIALPLKFTGRDGSPVRAIALED
jgi:arylformamidase